MELTEGIDYILLEEENLEHDFSRVMGYNDECVIVRAKKISNGEMLYDLFLPFSERFPKEYAVQGKDNPNLLMRNLLELYQNAEILGIAKAESFYDPTIKYVVPGNRLLGK